MDINNLMDNDNIRVVEQQGNISVLEYIKDLSCPLEHAVLYHYASLMNIRRRQTLLELKNDSYVLSAGAMQWMAGNIQMESDVKGVGDFMGKALKGLVTGEAPSKPIYKGEGYLMLEPTYKHLLIEEVSNWDGGLVMEDGMFLACQGSLHHTVVKRDNMSSVFAGEGLFNMALSGKGLAVLESNVPRSELIEVVLDNEEIKIDGSYAICWSNSLKLTVETSTKGLINSAVSGEGFVNVYRGTGRILMAPLQ